MPKHNINAKYEKIIAKLITKIDQLETELFYLNKILVKAGFPEGIKTLKETVEEVLEEGQNHHSKIGQEGFFEG